MPVKDSNTVSGFNATLMRGSSHNDVWEKIDGIEQTKTNHSGGIQGGISNGYAYPLQSRIQTGVYTYAIPTKHR